MAVAGGADENWRDVPSERVAVLLTDIEGSTPMWDREPERMYEASLRHEAIIAAAVDEHGGQLLHSRGEGDSTFSVFGSVDDAVHAAVAMQQALAGEPWTTSAPLRVRMAVHVGVVARRSETDYYGADINRSARIRSTARGGEVLLSDDTARALGARAGQPFASVSIGLHEL